MAGARTLNNVTCPTPSEVYIIKPSLNKGLGVFAARTLQPGTPIIREGPLVTILPPPVADGADYPREAIMSSLRNAFSSLSESDQSLYLSLYAHVFPTEQLQTDEDYLMPIFRSNSFNTGDSFGLFPKVSRINHSCRPNAAYFWNQRLGKRIVYAAREIKEGEEILVSYIPLLMTKAERAMRLNQYGFKCDCDACAASMGDTVVSDSRRAEIRRLMESLESDLSAEVGSGVVAKRKAQRLVNECLKLVSLVEAEQLVDYYAQAYRLASSSHARAELWEQGAYWALKSLEFREMADEFSPEAYEMRKAAASFTLSSKANLKPDSQ
ncbi:SET domain-containing protein [Glonium stellatum]|uniref:SET domain-containing protein n=1 Tax=Glonium stellatum TaxID=574774 RepID=A0A8E2F2D1_9PEZI|nr:SET domain-containing protein [Glonium stellatum]